MKGFSFMLLLLTSLLALPVGCSYACGKMHNLSKIEISHTTEKMAVCSTSGHQKSGSEKKMCGHSCDGSGCSCAHGPSVYALKILQATLLQKPVLITQQTNNWFFKESIPLPVYLSLWMPPNLNC